MCANSLLGSNALNFNQVKTPEHSIKIECFLSVNWKIFHTFRNSRTACPKFVYSCLFSNQIEANLRRDIFYNFRKLFYLLDIVTLVPFSILSRLLQTELIMLLLSD